MSNDEEIPVAASSGNVFADLGLPNADERLLKAELAHAITRIISRQGLTQAAAASTLGTDQAKVSALVNGRLSGFSIERLLRFLLALDSDIVITVCPKPANRASRLELHLRPDPVR